MELPNVFYALREIKEIKDEKKEKIIKSIFYNEFDSIFKVKEKIQFDENIVKINCKYEQEKFEDTKNKDKNILEIKGNNLVFVEVKTEANFSNIFLELFEKIYKFRNLIDNMYGTKEYGTIILYLYDTKFIYDLKDFQLFTSSITNAINICKSKNMEEVAKYNVYTFYVYDNVYLSNYSDINKKLEKNEKDLKNIKNLLNHTEQKLNNTEQKLSKTEQILSSIVEQLKRQNINIVIPDFNDNNQNNNINDDNNMNSIINNNINNGINEKK